MNLDTLENMCVNAINKYVWSVVGALEAQDSKMNRKTRDVLQSVKSYLANNLHPVLIDLLLNRLPGPNFFRCGFRVDIKEQMFLEVFCHENMIRFNPKFFLQYPPAGFYERKISMMSNIVELNLRLVATDEILKVVGESCSKLEVINIISRMGAPCNKMNALRLECMLSDSGLKYLHSCTRLRRIIMRKVTGSRCGGKRVTDAGIRQLLEALPRLQYIKYNNMGYVVSQFDFNTRFPDERLHLDLLHLHDNRSSVDHIKKIAALCPKLKTLCLDVHSSGSAQDNGEPGQCLKRLSEVGLNLEALSLDGFPCDEHFLRYFQLKGSNLRHLILHFSKDVPAESLLLSIGESCPNLVSLDLFGRNNSSSGASIKLSSYRGKYFHKLESLRVLGSQLDFETILNVCVRGANNLELIRIVNNVSDKPSRSALSQLMECPCFPRLRWFVCHGFLLDVDHLLKFLRTAVSLEKVSITAHSGTSFYLDYLEDIKVTQNLRYVITPDEPRHEGCFCVNI
ncbi:Hypothetical protein NTJ_01390 [Nesidiocoris tenuis]|uniref:Uncharacterized protein n=1 Tax=Nesidiocoris tenuis TaxID=355587 RepID=A0ABN7A8F4_9HEMI|nr:Hypothetical protein NTJ_01390 [Nesidiocoris tenuis]